MEDTSKILDLAKKQVCQLILDTKFLFSFNKYILKGFDPYSG